MPEKKGISYRDAGVDIEAADLAVNRIIPWVNATRRPEVLSDIGGFAGFFRLDTRRYSKPVLVSGTDGVGTKLKIAQMAGVHTTVGVDLVAMCVNDILVHGAEPLFFLDYLAVGKVVPSTIEKIVAGIARGCKEAGCALIGGETAEMPGFYKEDEYDLAGFAVGVCDEDRIVTGQAIKEGDAVVGLASSGLHSNGYSLARKILFDVAGLRLEQNIPELGRTLKEELLTPTRIYVPGILKALESFEIHGMAHITGGGIPGNLSRVIPEGLSARISKKTWTPPPIFPLLKGLGRVEEEEMFRTFNMGIGFIVVVPSEQADPLVEALRGLEEQPFIIGEISAGEGRVILID